MSTETIRAVFNKLALVSTLTRFVVWLLTSIVSGFIQGLALLIIPSRHKRWILMSSLYFAANRNRYKGDEEIVTRCNEELDLVDNKETLNIPLLLNERLWDERLLKSYGIDLKEVSNTEDGIKNAANVLVDLAPTCLSYGKRFEMVRDITLALKGERLKLQSV